MATEQAMIYLRQQGVPVEQHGNYFEVTIDGEIERHTTGSLIRLAHYVKETIRASYCG